MNSDYKYNEVTVRFYDVVYDKLLDKSGFNFYLNEIRNTKGKILEVGVGTGRIFVPALSEGADVYGIDQSVFMLNKLKEKLSEKDLSRISLQDVREFSLKEKFELIIAPFRVFGHLFSPEDQIKALNKISEHLEDQGRFIFDLFVPDLKRLSKDADDLYDFEGEYEPGKSLKRYASIRNNYIDQTIGVTFKYVWDEDGEEKRDEYFTPLRYYFRYELENLIARSNLKLDKIYGGFDNSELSIQSKDFVIICSTVNS